MAKLEIDSEIIYKKRKNWFWNLAEKLNDE